jgi:hypothetical protein
MFLDYIKSETKNVHIFTKKKSQNYPHSSNPLCIDLARALPCPAYSDGLFITLMMKAVGFSETSVNTQKLH